MCHCGSHSKIAVCCSKQRTVTCDSFGVVGQISRTSFLCRPYPQRHIPKRHAQFIFMKIRLLILTSLILAGCNPDSIKEITDNINGTWTLKKVLTTHRTFDTLGGDKEYVFDDNGTYHSSSSLNDILLKDQGYYEISNNFFLKPGLFLVLKGRVQPNSYGDTIRQHSMFEILTLTEDSLVLASQMQYVYDSFPNKWFNRKDYYVREK